MYSETQMIQQPTLPGRIILDVEELFLARGLQGQVKAEWVQRWEDLSGFRDCMWIEMQTYEKEETMESSKQVFIKCNTLLYQLN